MPAGGAGLTRLASGQLAPLADAYGRVRGREQRRLLLGAVVVLGLLLLSGWVAQVSPGLLWAKGGNVFGYFDRLLTLEAGARAGQRVWLDPVEWFWGLPHWLGLLGDTLLMAYVGTLVGATGGFLLGLLSAGNIVPSAPLRWAVKRAAEFCRTVPEIVFALVFVIAFGLGPLPGVLALALHTLGRARQAVLRGGREYRHEAGGGRAGRRRRLAADGALRRGAAGAARLPVLRAAAVRGECPRRRGAGLRRRRRASART